MGLEGVTAMTTEQSPENRAAANAEQIDLAALHDNLKALTRLHAQWAERRDDDLRRGLNDLNIFTLLRKKHDEVGLHSRFIGYLLNPDADHGQGDLFLEQFIAECGYPDFLDTKQATVRREHNHIDIYITDGNKHVIIENKIYAGDQPTQIKRYIGTVISDEVSDLGDKGNTDDGEENILVIYLSLRGNDPSKGSLGEDWEITGEQLVRKIGDKHQYCKYKAMRYALKDNEGRQANIRHWLSKCHEKIRNITNLSVAITQYREVIDKLYDRYEGKTMNFLDYVDPKGLKDLADVEKHLDEINLPKIRRELAERFWGKVWDLLEKEFPNNDNNGEECWQLIHDKKVLDHLFDGRRGGIPIQIRYPNCPISFCFEYQKDNHKDILGGLFFSRKQGISKENIDKIREQINDAEKVHGYISIEWNPWWWRRIKGLQDRLLSEIVCESNGIDEAAEKFVKDFMFFFNVYKDAVISYPRENPQ